jgi:transcriptional regulator with PAS, ATPase and Fis domain
MPDDLLAKYASLERYVAWSDDDASRVHAVAELLLAHREDVIDDFYAEIQRHPAAAGVITGGERQIARLRRTLETWLQQLLLGPYDRQYVQARVAVGRRHVAIGLEQVYANAALARMRTALTRILDRHCQVSDVERRSIAESLHKRLDLDAILIQEAYESEFVAKEQQLSKRNLQLRTALDRSQPVWQMIGESTKMHDVYRLIERAGPTDKPILIQGESGTGKELVARALHRVSQLRDEPLVTVNCAALPETLLESELFGHEKGAFTGAAAAKPGLFEVADGGTIFIDEIGELAGSLQAKLLRVLEDGHLRRLGSVKELRVKARLLAATNRDLARDVDDGRFREDLYYRINVLRISLPPLRERAGDLRLLVEHFTQDEWRVSEDLLRVLENYSWPGNVRQLYNALERAKILADDDCLQIEWLPPEIVRASRVGLASSDSPDNGKLEQVTRQHIVETLSRCDGNKARTARALGVSRRTLYRLLEKHNVEETVDDSSL